MPPGKNCRSPFPQERELAEKSARLAELDAALNMDDSHAEAEHISDEQELVRRPSVLADLKSRAGYSPIPKRETERGGAVAVWTEKVIEERIMAVHFCDKKRSGTNPSENG